MNRFCVEINGRRRPALETPGKHYSDCYSYDQELRRSAAPKTRVTVHKPGSTYFVARYGDATPGSAAIVRLR
jgi:hypothetical protein